MSAVLAIDQGTSGTKALLLGEDGTVRGTATHPLEQYVPGTGRIEQEPEKLWDSVLGAVRQLMAQCPEHVVAVALSTQRESVLAWDAVTREPLSPLISWQDRRTASWCAELADSPKGQEIARRSGLPVDPMFSATKAAWLLEHHELDRRSHRLRLGTVDGWLVRQLGGDDVCEVGNASRTQLLDVDSAQWSSELLDLFGIPKSVLPSTVPSTGPFGAVSGLPGVADGTPIKAVLGDSHAALYAQTRQKADVVKATYGSGSSLMALNNSGAAGNPGLSRTIAWQTGRTPTRAFEANIAATGTAVRWVRELLQLDENGLNDLLERAPEVADLVLVPAFDGLGAPYWDRDARAVLVGPTQATTRAELVRAAVESIGFQVHDALALFDDALGVLDELRADGGASTNDELMRFQADLCGRPVVRASCPATSALGVAYLAGARAGLFDPFEITDRGATFLPSRDQEWRDRRLAHWHDGLRRSRRGNP